MSQTKAQLVSGTTAQDLTVDNINTSSVNSGQTSGRKNFIINGAMKIAEHSDSNAGVNDTYAVDRFRFKRESTTANFSMTQSTISPDGFSKSLKVDCTSADTSTASNEFVMVRYAVEAQDLQQLGYGTSGAKPIVLSFYVRSNLTGVYSINCMQKDNSSKIYSRTYTINSADTWERKTISIPADTSGVINDDNGEGFQFNWSLILGSSYKGGSVSTAWETYANSQFGTQHGVNLGSSTSNEWLLTGVQLETGTTATDFEHRLVGEELKLCQRYFQSISRSSSTNSVDGTFAAGTCNNNAGNGGILQTMVRFQTTMRAAPTMTDSGTFSFHVSGVNVADTSTVYNKAFVDGVKITATQTAFVVTSGFCGELTSKYSDTSTATINADAEL